MMRNSRQAVFGKPLQRRLVGDRKAVDADAQHQRNLIDQHVADRAQFVGIAEALAQQRGVAEGAAVVESRERDGNDLQAIEVGLQPASRRRPA